MTIKVNNDGFTSDGCCDMSVKIERQPRIHNLCVVYFLAAIGALYDADERAFMDALGAFLENELEHCHDEE